MLTAALIVSWCIFLPAGGYFFTQGIKLLRERREDREKIATLEEKIKNLSSDLINAASDVRYLQSVTGLKDDELRPAPERIDEARMNVRVAKKLGVDDLLYPGQDMKNVYGALDRVLDREVL